MLVVLLGEIIIRSAHVMSDIPQRTIDEYGIQKYFPNQSGYWKGGGHKWLVNELGWPGELPDSYDNLITIIGDSFIENFMNPNECHQSKLLKERSNKYNFIEAARSGVSFIEAMEISKQLDSLNPKMQLIYVSDKDFRESVSSIKLLKDITQFNIESNKVVYGEMKASGAKKILYNWKLLYYFYSNFLVDFSFKKVSNKKEKPSININSNIKDYSYLLNYVKANYSINDKVLVFHPNSKSEVIDACEKVGFNILILDSTKDRSWSFDHDSHWTCYGHGRVADQVSVFLNKKE